jgi:hypothetical protein
MIPSKAVVLRPLILSKRLCDVFGDTELRDSALQISEGMPESVPVGQDKLNRIAAEVGSRTKAFQLAKADHKLVRFYPDFHDSRGW